ncbi:hypothetical protein ACEPAF_1934 [Sanghuangporus sanghuang]
MSTDYRLRAIRVEDLKWEHPSQSQVPNLFVKTKLGDVKKETRTVVMSSSPTWNVSLPFLSPGDFAMMEIKVKVKRGFTWKKDPCIGFTSISIRDLLRKCDDGEAALSLIPTGKLSIASAGRIVLNLEVVDYMTSAIISLATASEDIRRHKIMRSERASDVTQSINGQAPTLNNQGNLYEAIGKLLSRLDAFQQVVNTLSEIHPFLAIAWKLVTGLYKVVEKVFRTDTKVIDLVRSMVNAFDFVRDVQTLQGKSTGLQEAIVGLLKQTIECCLFVSRYTSRSFLGRMFDVCSGEKIDEFERSLASFKQQIESGVILHTAVVSMRMPEGINDLLLQQRLSPGRYDAFDRPLCLPETRAEIRGEIVDWVFSDSRKNIFWLHGIAGSGKSTVGSTIAKHFREMSRLGAFLFFQRGKSDPSSVIRTIAYKLALFDSSIGSNILSEVENDKDISSASSEEQFRKLLLQPLLSVALTMSGPVLVVLDALDECGTADSRRCLMELFQNEFSKLPNAFRFLITSRREEDINNILSMQPESVAVMELDYASAASQRDVLSYLDVEMRKTIGKKVKIPEDYPWNQNIMQLGKAAGGLFIWASTAVKMVGNGVYPLDSIDDLVSDTKSLSGFGLRELYAAVLRGSGIPWDKERSKNNFRKILMIFLAGKVPMSSKTIDGLLGFQSRESCTLILSRLQSLISYTVEGPISLFHASFSDYLTSPDHSSEPWFIDVYDVNRLILERCFSVMENMLHFNMCRLETSFVCNDDVPDFAHRVQDCIPSHLEYACIHWVQHLRDAPYSPDVFKGLNDFVHQRLLFWFEVLSLINSFGRIASHALLDAVKWIKSDDANLSAFLLDASELATIFALPVITSAPQIYVTMIPFSNDESMKYMRVLKGHCGSVLSISISSDGRLIASCGDVTIRVWDFHSGEESMVILDDAERVNFLPDGRRLASGSSDGTLRIWDVQTGELVLGPFWGHGSMESLAVAPDGMRIASGGCYGQVVVWDISDGSVSALFVKHTDSVLSVSFSGDGKRLASGSQDGTIRIWDIDSGETSCGLCFSRCVEGIRSLSFSPDGKNIMFCTLNEVTIKEVESGSIVSVFDGLASAAYSSCGTRIVVRPQDGVVLVLDSKSGDIVSGPFEDHTGQINSVAFSPNGRHLISCSEDETVRIWDTSVEKVDPETYVGHRIVTCVTISDDGSHIASASSLDGSIIIWDAKNGNVIAKFHNAGYSAWMAFSSNNTRLVSRSWNTMCVWDVKTGQLAFGPTEEVRWTCDAAVSPDGAVIAFEDMHGSLVVWFMTTGRRVAGPLDGFLHAISSLEFSPDGKQLASCIGNGSITIWNTATCEVVLEISTGHTGTIASIRFSPDGTKVAAISTRSTIIVWDAKQGHVIDGPFEMSGSNLSLAFAPDGLRVVSRDVNGYLLVQKLNADRSYLIINPHRRLETFESGPLYSRDGSRIVSCFNKEIIRVWDVPNLFLSRNRKYGANSLSEWILDDNGWIVDRHDSQKLLIWIPHDLRETLHHPRNTAVLNCEFSTKLDFAGTALGDRWSECCTIF